MHGSSHCQYIANYFSRVVSSVVVFNYYFLAAQF